MKYLVTNPDSFGDMVLRQPLLTGLLDAGHDVALLVKKSYSTIVRFIDPRLKMFIIDDLNPYTVTALQGKESVMSVLNDAAAFDPDVVVAAPYQRTVIDNWTLDRFADRQTAGMSGIEVEYENDLRVFRPVTRRVNIPLLVPEDLSEVEKNRRLLSLLLGKEARPSNPRLKLPPDSRRLAESTLKRLQLEPDDYIVCALGSASVPLKQYPPARFTSILSHWAQSYRRNILLVGNKYEQPTIDEIAASLRETNVHVSTWIGNERELELLLGLVSLSKAYFGDDTGPMHFAAAFGKPVIAIFGGGTWPRFIPSVKIGAVVLQELPCFGCGWQCIFEKAICIQSIREKRIIEAIDLFEGGTMDSFTIHSEPFEGEISSVWVQEAREKLKSNKELIEVNRVEREKESKQFDEKVRELTGFLQSVRAEHEQESKQHEDKARELTGNLLAARAEFDKELNLRDETIRGLTGDLQAAQADRDRGSKQHDEKVRELNGNIQALRAERERESKQHDERLKALTAELQPVRASLQRAQEQTQTLATQIGTCRGELAQVQEVVRAKDALNSALLKQVSDANQRIESLNKQHEEMNRFLHAQISEQAEQLKQAQSFRVRADDAERRLAEREARIGNAVSGLLDLKPKLEELHLAVSLQENASREFEAGLNGLMKSGWMRLGIRIGIPWLTRWHREMFGSGSLNAPFPDQKDKFQAVVSYKELLRSRITEIASTLGG